MGIINLYIIHDNTVKQFFPTILDDNNLQVQGQIVMEFLFLTLSVLSFSIKCPVMKSHK